MSQKTSVRALKELIDHILHQALPETMNLEHTPIDTCQNRYDNGPLN
jgi:hypothetical protein